MWIEHTQPPEHEMKTDKGETLREVAQCPLCREWSLEVVIIDGKPHYECVCGYRS